tara:strand:- start:1345 stop:1527 length:183 start_codon:yes stop_codon:yes gene_type:complete
MSVDVIRTCQAAVSESANETPVLAITLASLFAVYVFLDSVLAFSAIVRKTAEAEAATQHA